MNERGLAAEILLDITAKKGYNNIVLKRSLSGKDSRHSRAFVTECVNGSLRRLLTLDYVIGQVASVPGADMEPMIRSILRVSVYQLMYMRTPAHSVCDEAVKLAAEYGFSRLKGFVNGVLRNIIRKLPAIMESIQTLRATDPAAYAEIAYSCPRAVFTVLSEYISVPETEALLSYANEHKPMVTVCVNRTKTDKATLADMLRETCAEVLPGLHTDDALRISNPRDITELRAFTDGLFHVQDEGAMLAVKAAVIKPGQRVLDVCAAPGGKSFLAAYETGSAGAVEARDIHDHRLKLIEDGAKRLGISNIIVKKQDAAAFDGSSESAFDVVLADVPCSGLGLLGKKPDIRYNFNIDEAKQLEALQRKILDASIRYVKPGGTFVYSTCTLRPEENEENAVYILQNNDFTQTTATRLLPHKTNTDGFFIASFKRRG